MVKDFKQTDFKSANHGKVKILMKLLVSPIVILPIGEIIEFQYRLFGWCMHGLWYGESCYMHRDTLVLILGWVVYTVISRIG